MNRTYLKIPRFGFRRVRPTHQMTSFKPWIGARGAPYIVLEIGFRQEASVLAEIPRRIKTDQAQST